ncbi:MULTISPECIES: DUF2244 domain-containing protein [unclassified Caulobacter]|uniref:DUF2244 domain-containing protein n=1 Tax=unclassified Caulobacter TaxID=2648921 RepID=UPI000D3B0326|nr:MULTISPECIES: DUF2244 domain-containing protein [unclassified Caulobacter]PTS81825.1 hypothetical protein DBR21_18220 [Caulobacter sp. HMWF009]PTT06917.1 hypothetical protein DBR10_11225 [Caulobacter sp. HMWF025]PTT74453.1 hypothetical protein DBR41_27360 [Pseudomonas sp. HMWF010]
MAAPLYMDAVITPNRSLSRQGLRIVLGVVIAFNLLIAVFLLVLGAPPVLPFLGLDVLAIWWALRTSFRAAERRERVRVTAEAVTVSREDERGARVIWTSPTAFTGVDVDQPGEHEARVRIRIYRRRLTLGRALSPPERVEFGDALRQAIRDARSERYPHAGVSA